MCDKTFIILNILLCIGCGYGIKTPLTVVNPQDLIAEQSSKLELSHLSSNLKFLQNLPELISTDGFVTSINDPCSTDILKVLEDASQMKSYALTIIDSWGKPESGFLEGNSVWDGLYYECLGVVDKKSNVSGKFFEIAVVPNSLVSPLGVPSPALTIGTCFPDSCSASNITDLFTSILPNGTFPKATCPIQYTSWGGKEIVGLVFVLLFACLVIISTIYDYVTTRKLKAMISYQTLDDGPIQSLPSYQPTTDSSTCHKLLVSFSAIKNTKTILNTKQRPGDISCLHGLRFLSMTWVLLGHSFVFAFTFIDDLKFLANYVVDHYEYQAILNATYSVDSFFFLSGLLVAYLGLRQLKKSEGKMNVPMMYLYRYLRLTPPYAFLLLVSVSLWPKFGGGPMWGSVTEPFLTMCNKYWYTNLLYFSNLYPANLAEECYAWGWYLSNDTQFYILSPIFLLALYKSPKIGLALLSFILTASMAITGAFSAHLKIPAMSLNFALFAKAASNPLPEYLNVTSLLSDSATPPDQPSFYMSDIYAKPWCRIGAYIVGMITGYILHANNNKVKMNKAVVAIGWILASIVNFLIIYCLFPYYSTGHDMSVNLSAFYNAVSRPVWCVGLAWVTVACVSGYGGPVNTLLSWKAFIPLSRLTYCTYLVHPLCIWWFLGSSEVQIHLNMYTAVMVFCTMLIIANLFAFMVAILVEFPVIELLKLLKGDGSRSSKEVSLNTNKEESPVVDYKPDS